MSISGGITKISTTGSDFTNTVLDNIRLTAFWSSLIGVGVSGNNATGTFNTILGYEAVNQGRFGDFNVVVGTRAATFMEGQRNTLLGTQVAARLFYGNDNTITGCDAASAEVFGAENTLYGSLTAFGEGGIGNACFGYNARTRVNDATGAPSQHSVAFGHSAAATGAYAVALGGTAVALGDGALAVGPRSTAGAANTVVVGADVATTGSNSLLIKPSGAHALRYESAVDEELNVYGVLTGARDTAGHYNVSLASDALLLTNTVSSVRLTASGLQLESRSNVQVLSQLLASGGMIVLGGPSAFMTTTSFYGAVNFTQPATYDQITVRALTADSASVNNLEITGTLRLGNGLVFPETLTLSNIHVERTATFAGPAVALAGLTIAGGDLTLAAPSALRASYVAAELIDTRTITASTLRALDATACNIAAARVTVTGRADAVDISVSGGLTATRAALTDATASNLAASNLTARSLTVTGELTAPRFAPTDISVSGLALIANLAASNIAVPGTLQATAAVITRVTASEAAIADLAVTGSARAVDLAASNLTVPGRALVGELVAPQATLSNLTVTGAVVADSVTARSLRADGEIHAATLRVVGDAVFESGIRFSDSGTTFCNLEVDSLAAGTLKARSAAASNLEVTGRAYAVDLAASNLRVDAAIAATSLSIAGRLTAASARFDSVEITRAVTMPPDISFLDLTVGRDLTVIRAFTVQGFARLAGDALLEGSAICRSNLDALGRISAWGGLRVHGPAEFEDLFIEDLSVADDLSVAGTLCNTGDTRLRTLDVADRARAEFLDAGTLSVAREASFAATTTFAAPAVFNALALFNAPVVIEGDLSVNNFIADDIRCNTITVVGTNTLRVFGNSFLNSLATNRAVTQSLQVTDKCEFSNTFVDGDIWVEWEANVRTLIVRQGLTVSGGAITIGSDGDLNVAGSINISGTLTALPGSSTLIDGDFTFGRDAKVSFHSDVALDVATINVVRLNALDATASNLFVAENITASSVTASNAAFSNLAAAQAQLQHTQADFIAASNIVVASLSASNATACNLLVLDDAVLRGGLQVLGAIDVAGNITASSVTASNAAFSNLYAAQAQLRHADANVISASNIYVESLAASNASACNLLVLDNAVIRGDLQVLGSIDGHINVKFSFDRDTLFRASIIVNNDSSTYGNMNSYGYFNSVGTSQFWSRVSMYADMDTDHCITMYNPLDSTRQSSWHICLENPSPDLNHMAADFVITSWKNTRFALTDDFETGVLNFTGKHRCSHAIADSQLPEPGMVVCCNGAYEDLDGGTQPLIDEALPVVRLSARKNEPSAFGVIAGFEDARDTDRTFRLANMTFTHPKKGGGPKVVINSAGEGGILVCDAGGDLRTGDLLTTSDRPGLAMRQLTRDGSPDDLVRSHTVAKITCDCRFEPGRDRRFVGCVYKF